MKLKDFLFENLVPEIDLARAELQKELPKIFGDGYEIIIKGGASSFTSLTVTIYDTTAYNKIAMNSPAYFMVMLDKESISWELVNGPRDVSYRKITSKLSIIDATKKLIEWFKKNKTKFDAVVFAKYKKDANRNLSVFLSGNERFDSVSDGIRKAYEVLSVYNIIFDAQHLDLFLGNKGNRKIEIKISNGIPVENSVLFLQWEKLETGFEVIGYLS